MQLKDKKVLVFGAAKSGISATKLLQKLGAYVILYDSNTKLTVCDFEGKFDTKRKFTLLTGKLTEEVMDTLALAVLSPGVPIDLPEVTIMKEKNIPIWGEIELAYQNARGKVIGITGTNGKTTTTSLVGAIMKTYYEEVYVVGNIGNPYTDIALDTTEKSVVVAEISSFQLETIDEFKPEVSAILNITPDHLNRHHTMETYIQTKENMARNQTMEELCVLNYEDEILREMAGRLHTRVMFFSSARPLENGLFLQGDEIFYAKDNTVEKICNIHELKILGKHSYENVMAAVGIAITMGVPMDNIRKAITSFQAVEHRIEYVETIHGVRYYNDSKGTNPDASIKAVQAMAGPTILIGGGFDKGSEFDDWIESFDGKIKYLVLLGQTREKIAGTARKHGFTNIIMVNSLKDAVKISAMKAEPGDAVLLSPACASWGMFDNYEQRGRLFKEYVREMLD
ncbi:MAG TPA: UDP-N-acetylmuramoyl-L-alanine--D-glutamate ligase [Lachnospiraceae bacterium]|mgnify:FL=1|jgi:UDP-N-acetylmuramoylalanine--D-glutamate ligase|nr:UDP-N-acetylmuramoyl-L-alanine--D-glutamate ligase [Lachnospiraceae bacterium]HBY70902.1 UDP-N-acetylmuramoyl-L-alanine--D-glutamate ligase [Lachnospiraceae bacterium]HCA70067.1 UDP-N-acetylmuramoyl-L-alanine--D-glutamate ligase [Lachnospiraceae bacterium]HCM13305.1 UDP-N-acetylmuramoyl-L-alanine--D-glutamate ligase [Lachnospiraceae bacterium]HCR41433.1 UDP-N-acetylmuramoyl-L-alanine--D-glutamate ligase [Lachnospiraceae bacterium]